MLRELYLRLLLLFSHGFRFRCLDPVYYRSHGHPRTDPLWSMELTLPRWTSLLLEYVTLRFAPYMFAEGLRLMFE